MNFTQVSRAHKVPTSSISSGSRILVWNIQRARLPDSSRCKYKQFYFLLQNSFLNGPPACFACLAKLSGELIANETGWRDKSFDLCYGRRRLCGSGKGSLAKPMPKTQATDGSAWPINWIDRSSRRRAIGTFDMSNHQESSLDYVIIES